MENRIYLATCVPLDCEMEDRVKKHQNDRDHTWKTLEIPLEISKAIDDHGKSSGVILLDCLTLWVTNMLMADMDNEAILKKTDDLTQALSRSYCPVILVSNEVGAGIVPENKLARQFRDIAGIVNQKVAKAVDRVVMTVAGIPVTLKGSPCV